MKPKNYGKTPSEKAPKKPKPQAFPMGLSELRKLLEKQSDDARAMAAHIEYDPCVKLKQIT